MNDQPIEKLINHEEYKRRQKLIYECRQEYIKHAQALLCAEFMDSETYFTTSESITAYFNKKDDDLDIEFGK